MALLVVNAGCSVSGSFDPGTEPKEAEPAQSIRPTLGEIFRDGAYEFEDAPRIARALERAAGGDSADSLPFDEIVAKRVDEEGSPTGMHALAFLLTNEAAEVPDIWEQLVQQAAASTGREPERGTLDGAAVAYTENDVEHTLTIYYARDLVVTVMAPAATPKSELDDIGLYLLDAR